MIEVPAFIDLHTHTRYPDKSFFPAKDIEKSALNGGYSNILAMPNSEIVEGYAPAMPVLPLNDDKIEQIIAYMKTLK